MQLVLKEPETPCSSGTCEPCMPKSRRYLRNLETQEKNQPSWDGINREVLVGGIRKNNKKIEEEEEID